jgi:hypothetical protein
LLQHRDGTTLCDQREHACLLVLRVRLCLQVAVQELRNMAAGVQPDPEAMSVVRLLLG